MYLMKRVLGLLKGYLWSNNPAKQLGGKFAVTSENGINDGVSIKRPGA